MTDINIPFMELVNEAVGFGQPREEKEYDAWWPSGIGSCPTGRYLQRMKLVTPELYDARTLRVFFCGNHFEDWLSEAFEKKAREKFPDIMIERQVPFKSEELGVRGKADMRVVLPTEEAKETQWGYRGIVRLYEIKSKHSNAFHWMRKRGEQGQLQHRAQLWIGLELLAIEEGSLVYLSKDDLTVLEFPVLRNDVALRKIALDDIALMNAALKAQLPPPPLPDTAWQSKYCMCHEACKTQTSYLTPPQDNEFYQTWAKQ